MVTELLPCFLESQRDAEEESLIEEFLEPQLIIFITPKYRGVAKGGPGKVQAHPNVGCALPMKIFKNRNTLIEHSKTLLKQSRALIVPCQL